MPDLCERPAPLYDAAHIPDPAMAHVCSKRAKHDPPHVCELDGIEWFDPDPAVLIDAGNELGGAAQRMLLDSMQRRGTNVMTKAECAVFDAMGAWQRATGRMPPLPDSPNQ